MEIKITLSDYQVKCLLYEMADIEEYIQNWINVRAENAAQKLIEAETNRLLNDPNVSTMPASKEELVLNSPLQSAWLEYQEDCDTCTITETEQQALENQSTNE
jgi:hypothetical protein